MRKKTVIIEKTIEFLDRDLAQAIDYEDELELELGLAKKMFPYQSTESEIADLEAQLKKWREKIVFIKEIKKRLTLTFAE